MRAIASFLFCAIVFFPGGIFAGHQGKKAIAVLGGYYVPSFDKINEELRLTVRNSNGILSGDEKMGGGVQFGALFQYGVSNHLTFQAEISAWHKEATLSGMVSSSEIIYSYAYSLTPVLVSVLYYWSDPLENRFGLYAGGGGGIVFVSQEVSRYNYLLEDTDALPTVNLTSGSVNEVIFHMVAGIERLVANQVTLFAQTRYIVGKFTIGQAGNRKEVSISGPQVWMGVKFFLSE